MGNYINFSGVNMSYFEIIQIGKIQEVDSSKALVKCQIFGITTDFLPYKMVANSHIKVWIPPQIGEQVIVLFPFNNGDNGVVLGGIFNNSCIEPVGAGANASIVEFSDGTIIKYDTVAKALSVLASGTVGITAPNGITLTANTSVIGNVTISGTLSVGGGIATSGAISDSNGNLSSHTHSGVRIGAANTGDRN